MKTSPLVVILAGILAVLALASAVLAYRYVYAVRDLRNLQIQAAVVNNNRAIINALANDLLAYSYTKNDAALDRILESANVKPKSVGTKPAAK